MEQSSVLSGLRYLVPEVALLGAAAAALFTHIFLPRRGRRAAGWVSLAGYLAVAVLVLVSPRSAGELYSGSLAVDGFALYFKLSFLLAAALATVLAFRFFDVEGSEPGEAYYLMPLTVVGMMVAVSSIDLITTYVAFELFAIPSYVLAGIFKKDRRSAEAGVKYFFLGTLSSGVMLLGMAMVFGLTGETQYASIGAALKGADSPLAMAAMVLFLAGLLFKAAMVPFHMWAPDVYEGAPTPVTAFLTFAPKAAGLAVLFRVLVPLLGRSPGPPIFLPAVSVAAVLTMLVGNLAALRQKSVKRLLAYSAIAHSGYLLVAVVAGDGPSLVFYLIAYMFMNTGAFSVLVAMSGKGMEHTSLDDFAGLGRRNPWLAASLSIFLLSLAGFPPTAGFLAKFYVFSGAVREGHIFLAVAAVLASLVSVAYYLKVIVFMYMKDENGEVVIETENPALYLVLFLCLFGTIQLGLWPGNLLALIRLALSAAY